jgi:hypothetical protein
MHASRRFLVLALVALIWGLTGCGTSSSPTRTGSAHAASAVPAATAATVAALATDQACTRRAPAGSTLTALKWRADDLPAMTLPKSSLGSAVSSYDTNWLTYGFMDNVELPHVVLGPKGWCAINRDNGRIVGFSRGLVGAEDVLTANHLFFTASDAARWITQYVAGMKALVGTSGVRKVAVTSVASALGTGAVRISATGTNGYVTSRVLFRRGQVVGEVLVARSAAQRDVIGLVTAARALATTIARRTTAVSARGLVREDVAMQMSAGLPKSMLGTRYAKLAWDWFYGGCWDVAEAATQTCSAAEAKAYKAAAARYGQLMFCRAMYAPASGAFLNNVQRVFTGGTLYKTATGANDAMTYNITQWRQRAGRTVGGTTYGPLGRPSVPALGDRVVALQQKAGNVWYTRILARHGRYVAVAQLGARAFSGMTADVKRWAGLLDTRVTKLLATHTF